MKNVLIVFVLIISANCFGQDSIWIRQAHIREAIAFEKKLDSKSEFLNQNVSLSASYFPLIDKYPLANPIIVKRTQRGFLPLYAEYYYSKADSMLRVVSYDWERDRYGNFFEKGPVFEEESHKLEGYNKEYERIRGILTATIGEPRKTDKGPATKSGSRGNYLTRDTEWDNEIYHATLSMVFESMTYRIRLNLYWKK